MPPNTPIRAAELVKTLVRLSERAANVARSLRSKPQLLELLTEQKAYCPKLRRDKPDFKTLADVLIQETIRYYLGQKVLAIETCFPIVLLHLYARGDREARD